MDARTEQFAAELEASFKVEAAEHLKGISDGLLALEGNLSPEVRKETVDTVFRDAHSLKGAARAVNKVEIQDICQAMENELSDLRKGVKEFTAEDFDALHSTIEILTKLLTETQASSKDEAAKNDDLPGKLEKLVRKEKKTIPQSPPTHPPETTPYGGPSTSSTIRVHLQKLDKLMHEVEELTTLKLFTTQRHLILRALSKKLYTWKGQWSQFQGELRKMRQCREENSRPSNPSKEFLSFIEEQSAVIGELEETLQKLSNHSGQDARLTTSMIDTLLENTKNLLMLPFSSVFELFPLMVRDMSRTLNKNVAIVSGGGDVEVDRKILEEMKDPLIHLIRNCIDHGIESPEVRTSKRKDPQGRILISAVQAGGNRVEITLSDDGAGIDMEAIKKSAIAQGIVTEAEAGRMPEEEILKLIFKSGVSTTQIITEFSGRGVGMGVVIEKVEKLNGTISVSTKKDVGTTFLISLPLTIATFRGIYIKTAGEDYIFPTQYLVRVLRIAPDKIQKIEGKASVTIQGRHYSYIHLSDLLAISNPQTHENKYIYLLLIKVTETLFAVGVDQIVAEQEVLIKRLGNQLKKVSHIAGVTIVDEGKVVPILDPFDMRDSLQHFTETAKAKPSAPANAKKQRSIMVAEDSSTARMLLKNILESAGFLVKTAVNGAEAFMALKTEKIDLLISDVEMPRMDGFELTSRLRSLDQFKNLPIILCTSRGSQEDREHGIEVGANAYIDKNSFKQGHLLEIISKLL